MGAEVISIADVTSGGPSFGGDLYELLEEEDALEHWSNAPYFVFTADVPFASRARVAARIRRDLAADQADALLRFLDMQEWSASFLFIG